MNLHFGDREQTAAQKLIAMALAEDLGTAGDVTTVALIPADQLGTVQIVAREKGVLAGLPVARMVFDAVDKTVKCGYAACP